MCSLFHAFILCQLWTVYLEQIIVQHQYPGGSLTASGPAPPRGKIFFFKNLNLYNKIFKLHSVAKVYAVFPFYDVKCLCSGGQE